MPTQHHYRSGDRPFDMSDFKEHSVERNARRGDTSLRHQRLTRSIHFGDATFGSPTFGQIVGAGAMRKAQLMRDTGLMN